MIKMKVLSPDSELFETCKERVLIEHDDSYVFDRNDSERPFRLWITNTREYSSDKDAVCPVREEEREDGTYIVNRDGFLVFKVSAYIHSARVWSLGNGGEFPDFMWDVSSMGYLYTTRELWERCMGEGTWMKSRPGNPTMTFNEWARSLAKSEIDELNLAEFGNVYGYKTEKRVDFKRVYEDGHEVEDHEWEDGEDCWGFLTDEVDGIDFPRDPGVPVFAVGDDAQHLVGSEYTVPEFVIRKKGKDDCWLYMRGDGLFTTMLEHARTFHSYCTALIAARVAVHNGSDAVDARENVIELDEADPSRTSKRETWVIRSKANGTYFGGDHGEEGNSYWVSDIKSALAYTDSCNVRIVAGRLCKLGFDVKIVKKDEADGE